mgnify:CR=1 FL=1
MADLSSKIVTNFETDATAEQYNRVLAGSMVAELTNNQTLSANKNLADIDMPIQRLTPSGANQDVVLPTAATTNHPFFIANPAGTSYSLIVKSGSTALATLTAGESVLVISDGGAWSVFQQPTKNGWENARTTWTYTSADSPSFVLSVPDVDAEQIGLGWRIQLTQSTIKYFIVTAKGSSSGGNTPITVYGGTDYTLTNAAISDAKFSSAKAPFGFPLSPTKWSVRVSNGTTYTKTSPTAGTWYNAMDAGNLPSIVLPIGEWILTYKCIARVEMPSGAAYVRSDVTLSTSTSSESDTQFTITNSFNPGTTSTIAMVINSYISSFPMVISIAAKTTYYLLIKSIQPSTNSLQVQGASSTSVLQAVCAYL